MENKRLNIKNIANPKRDLRHLSSAVIGYKQISLESINDFIEKLKKRKKLWEEELNKLSFDISRECSHEILESLIWGRKTELKMVIEDINKIIHHHQYQ